MADQRVVEYIRRCMELGHSVDLIRQNLLNSGWDNDAIEEALRESGALYSGNSEQVSLPYPETRNSHADASRSDSAIPGTLEKLKLSILHPNTLFESVKEEKGFIGPLKFYILVLAINFVITALFYLAVGAMLSAASSAATTNGIFSGMPIFAIVLGLGMLSLIVSAIGAIVGTFIGAAVLHIFALIFGAKKGYQNTYKAFVYSSGPIIILLPLAFGLFFLLSTVYIIINLLLYVWVIALMVKGMKILHELSLGRALASVLTPILIGLAVLFLAFWTLMSFTLGAFNPSAIVGEGSDYGGMKQIATGFASLGKPLSWSYASDGSFRIVLKNGFSVPITITNVTADCNPAGLVTLYSAKSGNLAPNDFAEYRTSGEKCLPLSQGKPYSLGIGVSYQQEGGAFPMREFGVVSGRVNG